MKTFLTCFALLLAAGYPCVALVESVGAMPTFVDADTVVPLFSMALLGALVFSDYGRAPKLLRQSKSLAEVSSTAEVHRLAA